MHHNRPRRSATRRARGADEYPADDQLMATGRAVAAQSGEALHRLSAAPGDRRQLHACHQLLSRVSYGTIGPSLSNYGKIKGGEAETGVYDKDLQCPGVPYPCSTMPRLGIGAGSPASRRSGHVGAGDESPRWPDQKQRRGLR
jgi:hypothetical protein